MDCSSWPYTGTGVMVVRPLNSSAFHERIVQPVRHGVVFSNDGSDQGAINSLAHGLGALGSTVTLPSTYNALSRYDTLRPKVWRRWSPKVVHLVGADKPWFRTIRKSLSKEPWNPYLRQQAAWLRRCSS